ncbi:MAG: SRPBCC family protein, partial [Nitrosospira sp.]
MLAKMLAIAAVTAGGIMLSKQLRKSRKPGKTTIEESIEVNVPVSTVYNQWTQFEDFPKFMKGVLEVRQLDDTHLHWCAEVAGKEEEWDAEITEQIPDKRIAWRSTSGAQNAG